MVRHLPGVEVDLAGEEVDLGAAVAARGVIPVEDPLLRVMVRLVVVGAAVVSILNYLTTF